MDPRRLAAIAALGLAAAAAVFAVVVAFASFPEGLAVPACVALAVVAFSYGVARRGARRTVALALAALALIATVVLMAIEAHVLVIAAIVALAAASVAAAGRALAVRAVLPRAPAPRHPVLFFNPKSGGGKAERFHLAEEARRRGIEAVELRRGDDLEELVRRAVADGADALAMAGGDGSQAIVAAIAAENGLPYACVPAGTRNHFALDLGVDRNDVVGGLDALVDGGERRVDLGEVNGRVFVNNVSLGIYAEAVQRSGYRDAKLRTLLETVPDVLGPEAERSDLRWRGSGGHEHRSAAAILVSNNQYRLGRAVGSGTRPRIDDGRLGIVVVGFPDGGPRSSRRSPWREWSASRFEVAASSPVAAGIDGEAAMLDPPLWFRIRPGALLVRISRHHPGASPSAGVPDGLAAGIATLLRIALARDPTSPGGRSSERRRDGHLRGRAEGDALAEGDRDEAPAPGQPARRR